ncbi:MAG: NAD(P)H-dependent flavin oxidoreductase [Geminicoccaceae bacterium]
MWPKRDLIDLLQIEHPILQAPMVGAATPAMAAAVSAAGGLGGLGCGSINAEAIRAEVDDLRSMTNRPYNLNFFVHPEPETKPEIDAATAARVQPFYDANGLGQAPTTSVAAYPSFSATTLDLLLELRPAVVSFHFGAPELHVTKALHDAGCIVLSSATTVAEARALEAAGMDAIIAQGWEAGGHRGSFDVSFEDAGVGTLALVPQIVDAVSVPVIAAGGIADGRGIAAAFALGASGVQIGTAFLSAPESKINDNHRAALRTASDDSTRLTRAFSGRAARAHNTDYIEAMNRERAALPDYPAMYSFSDPLRKTGKPELQFMLYGQAAAMNRDLPATELMAWLIEDTAAVLRRLS